MSAQESAQPVEGDQPYDPCHGDPRAGWEGANGIWEPCPVCDPVVSNPPVKTAEGVGTGAGRGGDLASTKATLWVNGSEDCPEAPTQAHSLRTPPTQTPGGAA